MGVYAWIRDNVKRAVLLGFNDAIEAIGPPTEQAELNEHLVGVLKQPHPLAIEGHSHASAATAAAGLARPKRKRLGRSLEDIPQPAAPQIRKPGEKAA
jgi:hypothetical protein